MNNDKEFDQWNIKKQQLEKGVGYRNIYFNQGDVWWCSIGKNIGTESYGKGLDFRRPDTCS
jgi:mRNA interferase MazF